jgi:hypothetical protein
MKGIKNKMLIGLLGFFIIGTSSKENTGIVILPEDIIAFDGRKLKIFAEISLFQKVRKGNALILVTTAFCVRD